jgi:GT2 family glycosyltransferase
MKHYPDINQIVVDDNSPIGHGFKFTYRNYSNSGFTKTVNQGLRMTTADVILICNDDVVIKPGDLDRFYDLKGLVIASPRDTASDNTDRFGCLWGMTRETYRLLGNLDEKYRDHFSDVEYYTRAKSKGVSIIKWDDVVVEHKESATYKHADKKALFLEDQKTFLS